MASTTHGLFPPSEINDEITPLINDYNPERLDYDRRQYSLVIKTEFPLEIGKLLGKYKENFHHLNDYTVDPELIDIYFIWDFATSIVLNFEKNHPEKIKKYWPHKNEKFNPLKTKHLTNKATFFFNCGIIYSDKHYNNPLQNAYLNLFKSIIKIQRAWTAIIRQTTRTKFIDFLKKEINAEYPIRELFTQGILPLFEDLIYSAIDLAKNIENPYKAKQDSEKRMQISQNANNARRTGEIYLMNNYVSFFSEFIIGGEYEKESKKHALYRKEKFKSMSDFILNNYADLNRILEEYKIFAISEKYSHSPKPQKKSAPEDVTPRIENQKKRFNSYRLQPESERIISHETKLTKEKYNYGLNLSPENIDNTFRKWINNNQQFKAEFERICIFSSRTKEASKAPAANKPVQLINDQNAPPWLR